MVLIYLLIFLHAFELIGWQKLGQATGAGEHELTSPGRIKPPKPRFTHNNYTKIDHLTH